MFPWNRKADTGTAVEPLSDEQSRAQVVEPVRELAAAAGLDVIYATFAWEWCSDQGEPPFHGRVDATFKLPAEVTDRTAYLEQLKGQAAELPGWSGGQAPGSHAYGEAAHRDGTKMIIGPGNSPEMGQIQAFGECRNMNDHRNDSGFGDITDEIRGG